MLPQFLYKVFSKVQILLKGLLFSFALLLVSCGASNDSWTQIQNAGVLRVGLDPTYPPFEVLDGSGQFAGIDVDLTQALGEELGLNVQFVPISYDGLYDALTTYQVDVLISGMVIDLTRTRDVAYSDPYFDTGQVLIVRDETAVIQTIDDLSNKRLGVELGAEGHVEATTWARRLSNLEIVPYDASDLALTALLNGEVDAAVVDRINGRLFLKDHPTLHITPEPVTIEPFAFVVRVEDDVLLEQLNGALGVLQENGRLDTILTQWLGRS